MMVDAEAKRQQYAAGHHHDATYTDQEKSGRTRGRGKLIAYHRPQRLRLWPDGRERNIIYYYYVNSETKKRKQDQATQCNPHAQQTTGIIL
jgi:hypothetical protein